MQFSLCCGVFKNSNVFTMEAEDSYCLPFLPPKEIHYDDDLVSLLIRPLVEDDAFLTHLAVMESLPHLLTFMDWAHGELSVESQRERIKKCFSEYLLGIDYDFVVFDKVSEEPLLFAGLRKALCKNSKSLEIGYWTLAKHRNRGFATLVTELLIISAFELFQADRLVIGCNIANLASKRVIEKCGFKFESAIRNYFNKPNEDMLQNGYHPERTYLQYSLISEDLCDLPWYEKIKSNMSVIPFTTGINLSAKVNHG